MLYTSSARLSRASLLSGMKGCGPYVLLSSKEWFTIMSVSMKTHSLVNDIFAESENTLFLRRSLLMCSTSISVNINCASVQKGRFSANMLPFS